ncbi:MAG: PspC domain-containing protein [Proteobacteria bacterium]|jgi:phage shock protein C|nr:PspC domain-containing protein [Pseudomonadota bacterium]MDA1301509.1 PspC domain-containing protein [Pseudomonadota bacterium]
MSDYMDDLKDRELGLDLANRKIGGVCSGLAYWLGFPRLVVRVVALMALVISPEATLIAYGLAYFIFEDIDS